MRDRIWTLLWMTWGRILDPTASGKPDRFVRVELWCMGKSKAERDQIMVEDS